VPIDPAWTASQGLVSQPLYGLNQLTMLNVPIPWSVVEDAVNDLKRVQWGDVTDNFLWYCFSGFASDEDAATKAVRPDSAADWNVVVQNAVLCARMCREAGLKGFDPVFWYGVVGPAGIPRPVVERVQGELAKSFSSDAGRAELAGFGVDAVLSRPEAFEAQNRADIERWGKVAKALGLKID
jgi:hypothetical protein